MSRLISLFKNEKGQAMVEFALVFIIVVALTLAIAQFSMVLSAQIAVTNAAREGARAASVGRSDYKDVVKDAIGAHSFIEEEPEPTIDDIDFSTIEIGESVTVKVSGVVVKAIVPVPSPVYGESNIIDVDHIFSLGAESTMRLEYKPIP